MTNKELKNKIWRSFERGCYLVIRDNDKINNSFSTRKEIFKKFILSMNINNNINNITFEDISPKSYLVRYIIAKDKNNKILGYFTVTFKCDYFNNYKTISITKFSISSIEENIKNARANLNWID